MHKDMLNFMFILFEKFSQLHEIQLRAINEEIYVVHADLWSVNVFL